MQEKKWRLNEAYEFVAKKRPMIQPNGGFLLQLEELEKEIFGEVSSDTKDFIRKIRSAPPRSKRGLGTPWER